MAKKINAKARKEARIAKNKAKGKEIENKHKQEELAAKIKEEEELRQKLYSLVKAQKPELSEKRKSRVKAAGMKSAFYIPENRVVLTSFGKGNKALLESELIQIEDGSYEVKKMNDANHSLDVIPGDDHLQITGRAGIVAAPDNPIWKIEKKLKPETDLIYCKDKLEGMYFGKTFEDNIHIQIIHCIQDIEKIISVHANDIVFSLNNMLRTEGVDYDDLIGYLSLDSTFEKMLEKGTKGTYPYIEKIAWSSHRGYFGSVLKPEIKKTEKNEKTVTNNKDNDEKHLKYCFLILAVLGSVRQATAHGDGRNRAMLYYPDSENKKSKGCWKEALELLDTLYKKRVETLNDNFLKTSVRDLAILYKVYDENYKGKHDKNRLAHDYYKFVILKEYKRLGFSVKRLRETITVTKEDASWIRSDSYSSVRRKLYRMIDFLIWQYYLDRPENTQVFVEKLRTCMNEIEKEMLYRDEASRLWDALKQVVNSNLQKKMDGSFIAKIDKNISEEEEKKINDAIKDIRVQSENTHYFSKIIYLMTCFLDGKEINDLLTLLVNKFENIAAFLEVLNALSSEDIKATFKNEYKLFEESAKISEELRVINSFARMTDPSPNVKLSMMKDAAEILGYEDDDLDEFISNMMDPDKKPVDGKKKDNGFRNFIINNVIESKRFIYLVRYGNPKKIRKLAENKIVIDFILKKIPDEQIKRYYNSCKGKKYSYNPKMREGLAELIAGISFKEFEGVHQNDREATDEQKLDKERKKSLVNLYLTIVYLLLKNLVYVNARYYIAFHCLERDCHVLATDKLIENDKRVFAKWFLEHHQHKKRVMAYLKQNMENSDCWSVYTFRNQVDHMNPLRNLDRYIADVKEFDSYFALYHYMMQRTIIDQFEFDKNRKNPVINEKTKEYFDKVIKYGTYCKDFVKALNIPFAYNLPRYKNLSIDELFDKNNYRPEKAGKDF